MWKTLFYKEWLKTKKVVIGLSLLALLICAYMSLELYHYKQTSGEKAIWYEIYYSNYTFYKFIKFLPLLAGIVLPAFQFLPEIQNKRLKLTYHLPLKPEHSTFIMLLFGMSMYFITIFVPILIFMFSYAFMLDLAFVYSILLTIAPWAIAGFICYNAMVCILLEPTWKIRSFQILLLGVSPLLAYSDGAPEALNHAILPFSILAILWHLSSYLSAFRFAKITSN